MTKPPTRDSAAYAGQAERVVALLNALEARSPTAPDGIDADARDRAIAIVRESVRRFSNGDARAGAASAGSLTRLIVDGNGPREPDSPVLLALTELDRLRVEAAGANIPLLPRVAVRELLEARRAVSRADVRRIASDGVLVPTLPAADGVRLVQLRAPDGRVVIPAFCARELFDEWAAASGADGASASLVRIGDIGPILADRDGLALNPLNENVFVPANALNDTAPAPDAADIPRLNRDLPS